MESDDAILNQLGSIAREKSSLIVNNVTSHRPVIDPVINKITPTGHLGKLMALLQHHNPLASGSICGLFFNNIEAHRPLGTFVANNIAANEPLDPLVSLK